MESSRKQTVMVELAWDIPRGEVVMMDFWMSSGSREAGRFMERFKPHAMALGHHLQFVPHYHIFTMNEGANEGLCIRAGHETFCAPDPDGDGAATGGDVVNEDVRQLCVWNTTARIGNMDTSYSSQYWQYVVDFNNRCRFQASNPSRRFGEKCSQRVMRREKVSIKVSAFEERPETLSSDPDGPVPRRQILLEFIMAATFGSLKTEAGLKELNQHLASNSYVCSGAAATQEDFECLAQAPGNIDAAQFPHVRRLGAQGSNGPAENHPVKRVLKSKLICFTTCSLFVLKMDLMAMVPMVPKSEKPMVPKSEKPELLMSSGLVPELPGVPDKQQFPVTPRESKLTSRKQEESPAAMFAWNDDLQVQLEVEDEFDDKSLPDPIPTLGKKRRQFRQNLMMEFLEQYGFEEIDRKQRIGTPTGCFFWGSKWQIVYPVHLAARDGNFEVLALLLKHGVDKNVKSSKGQTPLDMARFADVKGSHQQVIYLLQGKDALLRSISVRSFVELVISGMVKRQGSCHGPRLA
eukprot:symbB.v1.2.024339.t1/scaffold2296.1/size83103/4